MDGDAYYGYSANTQASSQGYQTMNSYYTPAASNQMYPGQQMYAQNQQLAAGQMTAQRQQVYQQQRAAAAAQSMTGLGVYNSQHMQQKYDQSGYSTAMYDQMAQSAGSGAAHFPSSTDYGSAIRPQTAANMNYGGAIAQAKDDGKLFNTYRSQFQQAKNLQSVSTGHQQAAQPGPQIQQYSIQQQQQLYQQPAFQQQQQYYLPSQAPRMQAASSITNSNSQAASVGVGSWRYDPRSQQPGATNRYSMGGYKTSYTSYRPRNYNRESEQTHPQLYCDVCKISCSGYFSYNKHMNGQKHTRRVAALGRASRAVAEAGMNEESTKSLDTDAEQSFTDAEKSSCNILRCDLCDVLCTGSDAYAAHLRGSKHQKVVRLHVRMGKPIPSSDPVVVNSLYRTPVKGKTSDDNSEFEEDSRGVRIRYDKRIKDDSRRKSSSSLGLSPPSEYSASNSSYRHYQTSPSYSESGWNQNRPYGHDVNTSEDSLLFKKHEEICPTRQQIGFIELIVGTVERALKYVSDQLFTTITPVTDDKPQTVCATECTSEATVQSGVTADSASVTAGVSTVRDHSDVVTPADALTGNQSDGDARAESLSEQPAENTGDDVQMKSAQISVDSESVDIKSADVVETKSSLVSEEPRVERLLKGVMRIGVLAKSLLLKSETEVHLVVICSQKPTTSMLKKVVSLMPDMLKQISKRRCRGKRGGRRMCKRNYVTENGEKRSYNAEISHIKKSEQLAESSEELKENTNPEEIIEKNTEEDEDVEVPETSKEIDSAIVPKTDDDVAETTEELANAEDTTGSGARDKYSVRMSKATASFIVTTCDSSGVDHNIVVTFTSPLVRDTATGQSTDMENASTNAKISDDISNDDSDHFDDEVLDSRACLKALASLRHAKWFQARASRLHNASVLIRILRSISHRVTAWSCLSSWHIQLLVERVLGSAQARLSLAEGFRRVVEALASGLLVHPVYFIHDPCERNTVNPFAIPSISAQQHEDLMASAQHFIRLIAFRHLHVVLDIQPAKARSYTCDRDVMKTNAASSKDESDSDKLSQSTDVQKTENSDPSPPEKHDGTVEDRADTDMTQTSDLMSIKRDREISDDVDDIDSAKHARIDEE